MQAFLAEFNILREAIARRVEAQRRCLYFSIGVIGAVVSVTIQQENFLMLIGIPLILPFLYFSHREQSTSIGILSTYIKDRLAPAIRDLAGHDQVMQYERFLAPTKAKIDYHRHQVRYVFGVVPLCSLVLALLGLDFRRLDAQFVGMAVLWCCALVVTSLQMWHFTKTYTRQKAGLPDKWLESDSR
jgi:uncharacterized membrane protein